MHKTLRNVLCTTLAVAAFLPAIVRAEDAAPMPAGVRGEMIGSLMDAGGKIQELAAAMPESKYSWRPAKGVRSVGEVYLHVVAANYMLPGVMGVPGAMSMEDGMKLDKTPQTKEKTLQMLKDSYDFASKAIAGLSDADMEAQVDFFGQKMSKRALMMVVVGHSHEHLGQSIAYARMNGITPPWTAREMAAAAEKMKADKK